MILTPFTTDRRVYGGFDLSSTMDMTAFAMVQRNDCGGWIANWLVWLPQDRIEAAEKRDGVPYRQWANDGFLTPTNGSRISHDQVLADSLRLMLEYDIGMAGYDPWQAEWLAAKLDHEGIQPVKVPQGYASLSEPCKHIEACIADGSLQHGGHPIARWCAENIEVQTDNNGHIRPVKPKHGTTKRIDVLVAAVIAIAVGMVDDDHAYGTAYSEPGNLTL